MKDYVFTLAAIITALMLLLSPVFANTIGFNYSRAVDDAALGIHGDYEVTVGSVDIEAEGQLQSGDNLYVGNVDVSGQFNVKGAGIKLSSLNQLQGPALAEIGRQNTLDLAVVVPIKDVDLAIGVFGASGNPFAPKYELSDPLDPLSEVIESEAGITIPEGNRWGISAAAGLDVAMFEIDGRALLDPSDVTHQFRFGIGTGGDLWGGLGWSAKANIAAQSHKTEEIGDRGVKGRQPTGSLPFSPTRITETQVDTILSIDYPF